MQPALTISPLLLLTGDPVKINKKLMVFQPVLKDVATLGSEKFGALISIWFINRKDLLVSENDETWNLSDFEVMKECILYNPSLNEVFKESVLFFLHRNVEFLKMQRTIFIGELESGIELTEELFLEIKNIIAQVAQHKEEKKHVPANKKVKEIQDKINAGEEKLKQLKKANGIEPLVSQIAGFVAHSHKNYEEVFTMTMIQFAAALEKTVQIENYNISTMLSPYMDKKHKSKNKHWLDN